ncbi:MAG: hypothetical protein EXS08_05350 [Planctomycetes bacterium]|nr:hypothetical protein [Planctomycetota bacterium]
MVLISTVAWREGAGDAPGGAAAPAPKNVIQIQAKEIWTAGGQRVANGVLIVADGHVRSIGGERDIDPAQPLWKHDGILTAGLIACGTASGARGELQDDTRSVMEAAHAAYAFDAHSQDFARALAAGITAVSIQPGPENLVGGFACVVKTANGRVVSPESTLALSLSAATLGRSTTQGGFQFGASEEDGLARADGGPESSARTQRGTREPTSYAGALALLDKLFARNEGPFARAARGELPVTIEAWDRHEVLRAAQFAHAHKLNGAIRGAPLAGDPDVLAALKESKLGVIVGPYAADQTRPSLESVKRLAEAGVPVAFALDAPGHAPEELRLSAVRALAAGAPREAVWKALTEDAARLVGASESLGRLVPGQEADFVLWSGDPLDLQSRVVAVFVDGSRAWPAPSAR